MATYRLYSIFYILLFFQFSFADLTQKGAALNNSKCITFENPASGSLIKGGLCTLSILACPDIESIHLSACFFPGNGIMDTILDLGTISQPPFKLIWNIAEIPNQLFRGMGFSADAVLKNGEHFTIRHNGIFLYTKPVSNIEMILPSSADQQKLLFIDTLPSVTAPMILNALGNWNAQELHFTILVMDPSFSMTMSKDKLAALGVVVCIDPFLTKSAYPTESALIISFPLMHKSSRLLYKRKDNPEKGVDFTVDSLEYTYPATIKTAEGKGYGLDISIPKEIFGKTMPDSLSCNILIKVLGRFGQINTISLNRAGSNVALCPILWATMHRTGTRFLDNSFYVFFACFGAGLGAGLLAGFVFFTKKRKIISFDKLDLSEEEKRIAKTLYGYIEQNVTKKDMTLAEVARSVSIPGSKIEALIKKYNNLSFKKYLMHSRTEIAKERLRSSHASEPSIAESCGFKNIDEMEKAFVKHCRTTPYRYRRDNQVA